MSDKKISELPIASAVNLTDVSVLVSGGTNYQFAFTALLQLIGSSLTVGASISFGTALPSNTLGKNGDVFIKTNTGAFAQKLAGTWTIVYSIPSSDGLTDGTVLYGLGIPGSGIGNNNDTYINTGTGIFYKKAAGTWSQVFSMQSGPQGPQGVAGTNGTNGTNGFSVLNGTITPSNPSTGINGDFYINTLTCTLFGPKTGGVWGDGVSLVGIGVEPGGTTGQVLTKNSNNDYDTEWVDPLMIEDGSPSVLKVYSSQKTVELINSEGAVRSSADVILQSNINAKQDNLGFTPANETDLNTHIVDNANPHQVTLEQARSQSNQILGNIDVNNHTIINLADAIDRKNPLTKGQFDDTFSAAGRNKGGIDCSVNPNYPTSNSGDRWEVTIAGKIGGAAGISVEVYDEIVCKTTSIAGNQAAVGANFYVVQGNMVRATETTTGFSQVATNSQAVAMTNDDAFLTPLKGAALVEQKKKTVNYQINAVSLNEVSVLMENAGQVNSVLVAGATGVKLKIGIAGSYPGGSQTYPFAYAAGDVVYITYNYSNLADARCNVKLKCQDN